MFGRSLRVLTCLVILLTINVIVSGHLETVVLLSRKDVHERIKFEVNVEELMENSN